MLAGSFNFQAITLRQEDGHTRIEAFPDVFYDCIQDGLNADGGGKVATQIIETGCLDFAHPYRLGPLTGLGNQGTDDYTDDKERGKGEKVLGVSDGKGKAGGNEEKIEGQHAQKGGKNCGLKPETRGRQDNRQKVNHDEIGWGKKGTDKFAYRRGCHYQNQAFHIAGPGHRHSRPDNPGFRLLLPVGYTDHIDINSAAKPYDQVYKRGDQEFPPAGLGRLADDYLGDIVLDCI